MSPLIQYVRNRIYYKNPATCQSSTSTFLYKPTYKNNSKQNNIKIPPNDHHAPIHYHISVQSYIHPSLPQEKLCSFIHKSPIEFITPSIIVSNFWNPDSSAPPHSWIDVPTKGCDTMPPIAEYNPKIRALGRPLYTKRHATTLRGA